MSATVSAEDQKRAAAAAAALLVQPGMTVGLGTGSTAAHFVRALAGRGLDVVGVSTSNATEALALALGLRTIALDAAGMIDLTVDGADEIGPHLALIKGGGAALLREKLVWEASRRCVVIADAAKQVESLGRFALPIEVAAFGHASTARRLAAHIEGQFVLRERNGTPVLTDGGNVLYDLAAFPITDPAALGRTLDGVTGVVEHGLFLGLAQSALIGTGTGVETVFAHPI